MGSSIYLALYAKLSLCVDLVSVDLLVPGLESRAISLGNTIRVPGMFIWS